MGLEFDVERMRAAAQDAALGATDLAEELVRGGLPFRTAHELVGKLVNRAEEKRVSLRELGAADLAAIDARLTPAVLQSLDPARAVAARTVPGGPAPESVRREIARVEAELQEPRLRGVRRRHPRRQNVPNAPIAGVVLPSAVRSGSSVVENVTFGLSAGGDRVADRRRSGASGSNRRRARRPHRQSPPTPPWRAPHRRRASSLRQPFTSVTQPPTPPATAPAAAARSMSRMRFQLM